MAEECEKTDGVISVYSMEYDLAPTQPVHIKYWIGAVLRNNLLYAASKIGVGNGTLLELISRKESEEKQDNPRGFALQCAPIFIPETLQMGELFSFRLQLFGNRKNYAEAFHQAVVEMCKRGFGYPMTPMTIMSCRHCKTDFRGQNAVQKSENRIYHTGFHLQQSGKIAVQAIFARQAKWYAGILFFDKIAVAQNEQIAASL